jgi:hypothetical protein
MKSRLQGRAVWLALQLSREGNRCRDQERARAMHWGNNPGTYGCAAVTKHGMFGPVKVTMDSITAIRERR